MSRNTNEMICAPSEDSDQPGHPSLSKGGLHRKGKMDKKFQMSITCTFIFKTFTAPLKVRTAG